MSAIGVFGYRDRVKRKDVYTGIWIRSQYLLLTSPGSQSSDYMGVVDWASLHYSGFPTVMHGRTKSAVTQNY